MGAENSGYNPNQYRLETEVANRNSKRSFKDRIFGRNKSNLGDVIAEESTYSDEEKDHAFLRTFEVADRLNEAKQRGTTEIDVARERATAENEVYDSDKNSAELRAQTDEIIEKNLRESEERRISDIYREIAEAKKKITEAAEFITKCSEIIKDQENKLRYHTLEKDMPQERERLQNLKQKKQDAEIAVTVNKRLIKTLEEEINTLHN